jgi:hypothetical protein
MDGRVKKGIMLVIITDSPQDKESLLELRRIVLLVDASRSNSRTEAAENETTDVLQMLGIGPVHRWDEVIEVISGDWATQRQPQSSSLNHGGLQPFAICLLFQHVSDVSPPKSEMQISEDSPIRLQSLAANISQPPPRTVQRLQRLQPLAQGLLPSITPGAASFAQRFARQLARRILLRLADDVERRASSALMMN